MFLNPDKLSSVRASACLKALTRDWKTMIFIIALYRFASFICTGAQLTILAHVLSGLVIRRNTGQTVIFIALFCLAGVFRVIVNYMADLRAASLADSSASAIRKRIINDLKAQRSNLPGAGLSTGQTLALMTEADAIIPYINRYLPQVLQCLMIPPAALIYIAFINWIPALMLVITAPVIPLFMVIIGKETAAKSRKHWRKLSAMSNYFADRLKGASTLYLFNRIAAEVPLIFKMSEEYNKRAMNILKTAFLSGAVLDFFTAVCIACVAIYTGLNLIGFIRLGPSSAFTLTNSLIVLLIVPEFFNALKKLGNYYHDRTLAVGSVMHFQEQGLFNNITGTGDCQVTEPEPAIRKNAGHFINKKKSAPAIRIDNVSFSYGPAPVLRNVTLDIAPGEKIWLTGENGAGKTTLLSLLLKRQLPSSGDISVLGRRLQEITAEELFRDISWVGQHTLIIKGNIRSNILMGSKMSDQALYENILPRVSLLDRIKELPLGLDTPVAEDAKSLSGGERQKIALARALVKNSSILLLDEPLTHLDEASGAEFMRLIEKFTEQKTVILTGHDYNYREMSGYREFNLEKHVK